MPGRATISAAALALALAAGAACAAEAPVTLASPLAPGEKAPKPGSRTAPPRAAWETLESVMKRAAEAKRPVVLVFDDWKATGELAFADPRLRRALIDSEALPAVLPLPARPVPRLGETPLQRARKKAAYREEKSRFDSLASRCRVRRVPAVALLTSDGRLLGTAEKPTTKHIAAALEALPEALRRLEAQAVAAAQAEVAAAARGDDIRIHEKHTPGHPGLTVPGLSWGADSRYTRPGSGGGIRMTIRAAVASEATIQTVTINTISVIDTTGGGVVIPIALPIELPTVRLVKVKTTVCLP